MLLGARPLSIEEVVAVARHGERVEVDPGLDETMAPARAVVEQAVAEGRTVYGVTTGFGAPEPVKHFETRSQLFLCVALGMVGWLIQATVGRRGGVGRRWQNRRGLAV